MTDEKVTKATGATASPAKAAKPKTVKCRATYAFADKPVGIVDVLWGVSFTHEVVKQDGEDFHILTADLPLDVAKEMQAAGRVERA